LLVGFLRGVQVELARLVMPAEVLLYERIALLPESLCIELGDRCQWDNYAPSTVQLLLLNTAGRQHDLPRPTELAQDRSHLGVIALPPAADEHNRDLAARRVDVSQMPDAVRH
ncbi:hypothetical protein ACFV0Y_31005, partial [Streptomyces sp. NPDC059569]|uniref:hypothetical protein n=1 Tax=Streptomyces sp. NPDC059569 TaxID=3346869 RepID=UPI0036762378